jgi:hypothetical protein
MARTLKELLKSFLPEPKGKADQELIIGQRLALAEVSPEALAYIDKGTQSISEAASHSLARVHQHTQNREIGIITAHRGNLSPSENHKRNHALKGDIHKAGYGHIPIRGSYIENKGTPDEKKVSEHSFMVIGHHAGKNTGMKKFLVKHGKKYDQEAVVHKPHDSPKAHLHTTSGEHDGQSSELGTFHANKASDYHSAIKGKHKSFTFEEYFFLTEKNFFVRQEHLYE